eukprot:TRINITY_DN2701_c0_g1_i1.p1 TRINITY_DN2701_c0_g1~~TRINITY_DN2701_c0_g1_i1.p1  ORF type:complete len:321 (+),score=61.49 TRINITY_DN2701_c0_g1_i1:53-964(+)
MAAAPQPAVSPETSPRGAREPVVSVAPAAADDLEACRRELYGAEATEGASGTWAQVARAKDGRAVGFGVAVKEGSGAVVQELVVECVDVCPYVAARVLYGMERAAWDDPEVESVLVGSSICPEHFDADFFAVHGYSAVGDTQVKQRPPAGYEGAFCRTAWVEELQASWRNGIPVSDVMGIRFESYTDWHFAASAPLLPNINVHGTMFAGSIYSLATLAGWGATHLLFRATGLEGSIVLADASIKYRRPVKQAPRAVIDLSSCAGDFGGVQDGGKASFSVPVVIYDGDTPVGDFTGRFVVLGKR